jgi:hypothetical protein
MILKSRWKVLLHPLSIDRVVLPVRADKTDIDHATRLIDPNHESVNAA